jgi:hypothetical protein
MMYTLPPSHTDDSRATPAEVSGLGQPVVTPEDVEIRPIRVDEAFRLAHLAESTGGDQMSGHCLESWLASSLTGSNQPVGATQIWIARHAGRIVATAAMSRLTPLIGRVHDLQCDHAYQKTPLPLLLMTAVLERANSIGCLKVVFDASVMAYALLAVLIDDGLVLGDDRPTATEDQAHAYLNLYHANR